jgi:hypothetical protein
MALGLSSVSQALIPNLDLSTAATAATEQVSLLSTPDGSGDPLTNAYTLGGGRMDATVTLTLVDDASTPIFNYPFEDLWLETNAPEIALCPGGSLADANTDVNGQTTFTGSLQAGGWGEGLKVIVDGDPLSQNPLNIKCNSPDMNLDLVVNLTDIVLFAQAYFGGYDYPADYYWDEVINLSDIVLLAQGSGDACP